MICSGGHEHQLVRVGDKGECERSEHEKLEEFRGGARPSPPDGGRAPLLRTFGAHAPVLTNRRASERRTPCQPLPNGDIQWKSVPGMRINRTPFPLNYDFHVRHILALQISLAQIAYTHQPIYLDIATHCPRPPPGAGEEAGGRAGWGRHPSHSLLSLQRRLGLLMLAMLTQRRTSFFFMFPLVTQRNLSVFTNRAA